MTTTALAPRNSNTEIARGVDVLEGVSFTDLVNFGDQLTKTGFLPDHVRTGAQFAAIVMTGRELGMTPMRAMRSLQMVKGKVTENADSQLARFKAAGGRATFEHLDETKAVLTLIHPNGDRHTETWTAADSKRAGLSGGNHDKYPKAMLRSRVITAGLKSLGWDGAVGTYDPDELRVDEAPQEKQVDDATTRERAQRSAAEVEAAKKAATQATLDAIDDLAEDIVVCADSEALAATYDRIGDVAAKVGPKNEAAVKAKLIGLSDKVAAKLNDVDWLPADNDVREAVLKLERRVEERQAARAQAQAQQTQTAA